MAMTPQQIAEIDRLVQEATDRAIDTTIKASFAGHVKEIDAAVRKTVTARLAARQPAITERIELWLDANLDRSIEVAAKQMLDAALAEIRSRVLGRR